METTLLLISLILILCMLLHRYIEHLPIPSLLIFIMIGMLVGENGIFKIHFDNFSVANDVCTIALIFIMFYGGFGTNLNAARSVLRQSVLLSTVGVALTAGITGACLHFILELSWSEALLIGSVIASTDAASVFTLLRTKNLNLKDNTASMLEVESGSNDPMSYMLTVVFVTSMLGSDLSVPTLLFQQVFFGVLFGVAIAYFTIFLVRRVKFNVSQGETILIFSVALLAFALPSIVNGNGYLSAYLAGIFLGNTSFTGKRDLVRFFDVVTHVAQVMVFFLLGLLVSPAKLPETIFPAFVIMIVLTFVARPISSVLILAPFGASKQQMTLLSWAGLRGVASIVFSIYVVLAAVPMTYNLFNLVFCIVLMSMALQGSLLSKMSSVLDMIDDSVDVRNTFNYYQEEAKVNFSRTAVSPSHPWVSKYIKDIDKPPETLIALLIRTTDKKKTFITPNGNTQILAGDVLVFASRAFENRANLFLREIAVDAGHPLCGMLIRDSSDFLGRELVVMIQRGGNPIIPSGDTRLEAGDLLVLAEFEEEIER